MRRLERRVAYGEAPSAAVTAIIHMVESSKHTPKPIAISVTADDRCGDFLIPFFNVETLPYEGTFIGSVINVTTFSGTIK